MDYISTVLRYKECFVYDVEETIKNIMKKDNVTQSELARRLDMQERSLRRYLNKEIKITKVMLGLIGEGLKLPYQVILELYKNARIELSLEKEDVIIFDIIFNDKNIEKIEKLKKIL